MQQSAPYDGLAVQGIQGLRLLARTSREDPADGVEECSLLEMVRAIFGGSGSRPTLSPL